MPDLRQYVSGLEREILPPDFAALERTSRRRARVRAATGLALSTAALVAFVVLLTGGPAADRVTQPLPAVTPTTGPVGTLTAAEIVRLGGEATETFGSDDGVAAALSAHQVCPETPGAPAGLPECQVAYRVTGPGGAEQSYILTGSGESLGPVAYLGRGEFIVYCTICGDDKAFYTVSAALPAPRRLPADGRPSRPGPGRTLVPCRGDACVFDRTNRVLAHLDLATLPFWIDELRTKPWFTQEPGIEVLPTGQVYVPPDILLGGGYGPSPALVVTVGREARKLSPSPTRSPARPGLTGWVGGNGQGVTCPCVVDPDAATITQIDLPADGTWARSNANGWWGLTADQRSVWVVEPDSVTQVAVPLRNPAGFLTLVDGDHTTIAVTEHAHRQGINTHILHASLDRGRTWRTMLVPGAGGTEPSALLDPAWQTWPEVG